MLRVDANLTAPDSGIAVKLSASDDDKPHGGQSKPAASQGGQHVGEDIQTAVISDKGMDAIAEDDHGGGPAPAPHGAKKLKLRGGLGIDINKALHQDDDDGGLASPYSAEGGGNGSPHRRRRSWLQIKKQGVEIEERMLELERWRLRWAEASMKKDEELEKMRLENGRMKLENERLWVRLKRREQELADKSKRV